MRVVVQIKAVSSILQEHPGMGSGGGRFSKVIRNRLAAPGAVNDKTPAPDVPGCGVGHGQGKGRCHRRIHRIAALAQDLRSDARRVRFLRHHHPVLRVYGCRLSAGGRMEARCRHPDEHQTRPKTTPPFQRFTSSSSLSAGTTRSSRPSFLRPSVRPGTIRRTASAAKSPAPAPAARLSPCRE